MGPDRDMMHGLRFRVRVGAAGAALALFAACASAQSTGSPLRRRRLQPPAEPAAAAPADSSRPAWLVSDEAARTVTMALVVTRGARWRVDQRAPGREASGHRPGRLDGPVGLALGRLDRDPQSGAHGGAREAAHRGRPRGLHQRDDAQGHGRTPRRSGATGPRSPPSRRAGTGCSAAFPAMRSPASSSAFGSIPRRRPPASRSSSPQPAGSPSSRSISRSNPRISRWCCAPVAGP